MEKKKVTGKKRDTGMAGTIAPKAISQARNDLATWKMALKQAEAIEAPKRIRLQNLYKDISIDGLLTSQMENRILQTMAASFSLKDQGGKVNPEATDILKKSRYYYDIVRNMLDSIYYGTTVIEILNSDAGVRIELIPRNNIEPRKGLFLTDENNTTGIPIREMKEYGTWVLEFGDPKNFGLLNKAIPHVLFKRFAQSCWSELCEIYGIPPRVMKTNTQDATMLSRAEQMMRDMGAAAWFIIDETEEFEFAKGADSNGDVYANLIKLCNNENSMLISGAIIGQDTKNGNESKEKISVNVLSRLVDADKRMVASYFNDMVLGALVRIGLIPDNLTFEFDPQENIELLWSMVKEVLPHMEVDPAWIQEKFGIKLTGKKTTTDPNAKLSSFFD
jgi:phage gp29-like protein